MIYLDYNASTPLDNDVKEAIIGSFDDYGNPSSAHWSGRRAKEVVEASRASVANLIGASPEEILFTSGATEANNIALVGAVRQQMKRALTENGDDGSVHILFGCIEHVAVAAPINHLRRVGFNIHATEIPCNSDGVILPHHVVNHLEPDTAVVSIMIVNNELGSISDLQLITRAIRREFGNEILIHTDASQAAGKIAINVKELDVDLLTMAGHKMYAPKGVGALFIRKELRDNWPPLFHGAGHEGGTRPGTESVTLIAGFGKAAELALEHLDRDRRHFSSFRLFLLKQLEENLERARRELEIGDSNSERPMETENLPSVPEMIINSSLDEEYCVSNTLSVSFPGASAANVVRKLSKRVAISAGSACDSSEKEKPSAVLMKLPGMTEERARGTIRLSLGRQTTEAELEEAAELIVSAIIRDYRINHQLAMINEQSEKSCVLM